MDYPKTRAAVLAYDTFRNAGKFRNNNGDYENPRYKLDDLATAIRQAFFEESRTLELSTNEIRKRIDLGGSPI